MRPYCITLSPNAVGEAYVRIIFEVRHFAVPNDLEGLPRKTGHPITKMYLVPMQLPTKYLTNDKRIRIY